MEKDTEESIEILNIAIKLECEKDEVIRRGSSYVSMSRLIREMIHDNPVALLDLERWKKEILLIEVYKSERFPERETYLKYIAKSMEISTYDKEIFDDYIADI